MDDYRDAYLRGGAAAVRVAILRSVVEKTGGAKAAAERAGVNPRSVQRAIAGDVSAEFARRILGCAPITLDGVLALADVIYSPRLSMRRATVLFEVMARGVTTMRDMCADVGGDPDDSAVHLDLRALIDANLIAELGREPGSAGNRGRIEIAANLRAWRMGLSQERH